MVTYDKFMNGTEKYLEMEILHKMSGYQKWLLGTMLGITLQKFDNILDQLEENKFFQMLELIDENDMVDDDAIYEQLKKQAKGNPITIDLPLNMGKLSMNADDVEKWHMYIHE